MAQALVPLKDLVKAKSRLAGLLGSSERRTLAQAMVEDVLEVLQQLPELEGVTLVSDDPGARMLAENYGARCLSENSLGCRGLNQVVGAAVERLRLSTEQCCVILHGDLPLLTAADLSAAIAIQRSTAGLVIGCDRYQRGSNLLAFNQASRPAFCFGPDSRRAHERVARNAGITSTVLHRRGIALDVDEPQDLFALMNALSESGPHCSALLEGTELGRRLQLALATLVPGAPDPVGAAWHYE